MLNISFLGYSHQFPKCEVDSWGKHSLAGGQTVVPIHIGGVLHHQQAPMGQLQLDGLDVACCILPSGSAVPEDKVPASSEGHGCNGTAGNQFPLVISMLTYVVLTIFVPVKRTSNSSSVMCQVLHRQLSICTSCWVQSETRHTC